ncbi:MAG: hypothetical protein HS101_15995 [Planctomycetia bacterium]|nr:hypothetical protein [Planctomycetia bacterium]MCC7315151.1 hypothetical protein [Planctomycetota bacterium]OQY96252.1 MAG: hypothetical protein B6D36_19710 [Planctomycetes bacterium UTPLA1]
MKNPYDADNVLYATLIEQIDHDIAAARDRVDRTRKRFMESQANIHWTRHVAARADLVRLLRQVCGCESDLRAVNTELDKARAERRAAP